MSLLLLLRLFSSEFLFEGSQEVVFPGLSPVFWSGGIDAFCGFDALLEAFCLVCLVGGEEVAFGVGIVVIKGQVEYRASPDV